MKACRTWFIGLFAFLAVSAGSFFVVRDISARIRTDRDFYYEYQGCCSGIAFRVFDVDTADPRMISVGATKFNTQWVVMDDDSPLFESGDVFSYDSEGKIIVLDPARLNAVWVDASVYR